MFKVIKAVLNNMSETTYLKSVNNLEFKENAIEQIDSINPVETIDQDSVKEELDLLQNEMRHNNLKIFRTHLHNARVEQFLIVTLPALLVAGTLTLWIAPAKRIKTDNLQTYKKVETVICDNRQLEIEDPKLYYSSFLGRDYVDDTKARDFGGSSSKRLEIYITEGLEGFLAELTISSDGALSINDIDKGSYLNLNDYNFTNSVEMDERFVSLFDRTIELMLDSGYLSDSGKEELKVLSESDKKEIVAKIIEYQNLGYTDVDVYKSTWFWRITISLISGIYLWALGYILKNDGIPEFYEVTNNNGELVESEDTKNMGLFYLGVKYKEAFLAAERDRIRRIYELADKNLISESRDNLLTDYERKLVLSPRKGK